jgi:pyridoxamine 5'-phosphate oxidase
MMQYLLKINQTDYNLEEILADCWLSLVNGVENDKHPFRCAALGTIDKDEVEMRTVVLRKVIPDEETLIFYSDNRSPKVEQLRKNNKISWLFYDEKTRIQIRIKAEATIHHQNELTLNSWEDCRLESRRCYMVNPSPSCSIDFPTDGLPHHLREVKNLTKENVEEGFQNFVVVKTKALSIDWLFLNHAGHCRAKFTYENNNVKKEWMLP